MKSLLEIGSALNYGAPGRIAEQIGLLAKQNGWAVYMAHGNKFRNPTELQAFQTVSSFEEHLHEASSCLLDNHGLASRKETLRLCDWIDIVSPDIVHLHNIHGYFVNYPVLFDYLRRKRFPIVWTLHDCWPITGHCSHFDFIGCYKWKTGCHSCPGLTVYPKSLLIDRSERNYSIKKYYFTSVIDQLTLVPVSDWIAKFTEESFLSKARIRTIHNGVDTDIFIPRDSSQLRRRFDIKEQMVILGVASPWSERKGLKDWFHLFDKLPFTDYRLILVGLNEKQLATLPSGIIGIQRTNSPVELSQFYSLADVFLNLTYEDNFPTVNLEALSCGTPVITYNTGGSPEAIDTETGWVVEKGDLDHVVNIITSIKSQGKNAYSPNCRSRAVRFFDKDACFKKYISLYEEILKHKSV